MPFNVQQLVPDQQKLVTAYPNDPLQHAVDRMTEHGFSQLPVVDDQGRAFGLVTSDSILSAINHFGVKITDLKVTDAVIKADEYRPEDDLFDLLDALRDKYAVLIVDGQKHLRAIVTGYDATEYFRRRAEDFMIVEDIESALREHIRAIFTTETGELNKSGLGAAIQEITDSTEDARKRFHKALKHYVQAQIGNLGGFDEAKAEEVFARHFERKEPPKEFDRLTLAEYIALLLHDAQWEKVRPIFDRDKDSLQKLFHSVRDTRNDLAHFRSDISPKQRDELRFCSDWLSRHQPVFSVSIMVPTATATAEAKAPSVIANGEIAPTEESIDSDMSKYAPLALFLQSQPSETKRKEFGFDELESIIGDKLPPTARQHRSWWANDSVGHIQSQEWLDVGWRVAEIDITGERVTFARIVEKQQAYIHFYSRLLTELTNVAQFPVNAISPQGVNWQGVVNVPSAGERVGSLYFSFTRRSQFRVEFYIDTTHAARNKQIFDYLHSRRQTIETDFGQELRWERLDTRRGCRIAVYRDGAITDSKHKLDGLREWGIKTMVRFQSIIDREVRDLLTKPELGGQMP